MKNFCAVVAIVLVLGCRSTAVAEVLVDVTETPLPDGAYRYDYRVINPTELPLVRIQLGMNRLTDAPELTTEPRGYLVQETDGEISGPEGWTAEVIAQEESDAVAVAWGASSETAAIPPGRRLGGFSVILPKRDLKYQAATVDAVLSGGRRVRGRIESEVGSRRFQAP